MILTQMLCLTLMFLLQSANDQSKLILVQSVLGIQAIEDQTIRGILALAAGPIESPHSFRLKYCEAPILRARVFETPSRLHSSSARSCLPAILGFHTNILNGITYVRVGKGLTSEIPKDKRNVLDSPLPNCFKP